ncbi:MAG: alpha/beta hydrolase [Proteobacteria bacterium]|nr:alpha/beta hydrolase [Pseudomonadota bacterium]
MATFVLIHGAYQGGWIWRDVAGHLRAKGHLVLAPSLDGCAERGHLLRPGITTESQAAELARLLHYEDIRDAVLAGTSTGGMVMCSLAEQARPRVRRLVFVDALALLDGERLSDFVARPTAIATELTAELTPHDVETRLFKDLAPELRAWAAARIGPHPRAAMEEAVALPSFWSQSWAATVIHCTQSPNPPAALQRRTAERLNAAWHALDTGHYPMLSMPEELAALIAREPG